MNSGLRAWKPIWWSQGIAFIEAIDSLRSDVGDLRSEMQEGFSDLRVGQNLMAEALIVLIDPRDIAYTPVRQDLTKRLRSHFKVSED